MRTLSAILLTAFLSATCWATAPDSLWNFHYVSAAASLCRSVVVKPDGNYFIAGGSAMQTHGGLDGVLIELNPDGDSVRTLNFGGPLGDRFYDIETYSASNYACAGWTLSYGSGSYDFWLLLLGATGDSLMSHTYGGAGTDGAYTLIPTSDGGFAIAGFTQSFLSPNGSSQDMWLVKTNGRGDSLWSQHYGTFNSAELCECRGVTETSDGGFLLVGMKGISTGESQGFIVKTNSLGAEQWRHVLSDPVGINLLYEGIEVDGRYIVAGRKSEVLGGADDAWLIYLDAMTGDTLYTRTYGTDLSETFTDVEISHTGGLIMSGGAVLHEPDTLLCGWIMTATIDGDSCGSTFFRGGVLQQFFDIELVDDGSYVMAGYFTPDTNSSQTYGAAKTREDPCLTPEPVDPNDLVIWKDGDDAVLQWSAVTESVNGCCLTDVNYLVYSSPVAEGPYTYLGFTTTPNYTHAGAVAANDARFYAIESYMGPPPTMRQGQIRSR